MFVPDHLKNNAFRILRVSAEATLSEIHNAAGEMRRAALLDAVASIEADIPQLGKAPRSEADIRAAVGRIENPESRIADRLFWFHSFLGTSSSDLSLGRHDAGLQTMFETFTDQLTEESIWRWAKALRMWHEIVADDEYWLHVSELEIEGGFEPTAFPSEIEELRNKAVAMAAEPLVVGAREALSRGDTAVVRLVLFTLEQMADTGGWVATAQKEISAAPIQKFKNLCSDVLKDFEQRIARQSDAGKQNLEPCRAQLARFRADIEPELSKVTQILPPGYEGAQEAREEAAILLSAIATNFTWADEFIESEKLYEEALKLAQNTLGAIRIQARLEEIRASAQHQRVFGRPIDSTPSLGTFNGIGFTVYGCSDVDPETKSYTTTHYFTFFYVPIFPIARYRVIDAGVRRWRFLGKLPLGKRDHWHIGMALSTICVILVWMIASSNSTGTTYRPVTASSVSTPSTSSASSPSSGTDIFDRAATTSSAPSYTPSTTISEPSANDSELASLRGRIESGRSQMKEIESRLQPVIDEISSIDDQMKPLKSELDDLKREQSEGIDVDTDHYNSLVDSYNSLLRKKKSLIGANQADFDEHETLTKEDASMMDQWRALGGRVQ